MTWTGDYGTMGPADLWSALLFFPKLMELCGATLAECSSLAECCSLMEFFDPTRGIKRETDQFSVRADNLACAAVNFIPAVNTVTRQNTMTQKKPVAPQKKSQLSNLLTHELLNFLSSQVFRLSMSDEHESDDHESV